MQSASQNSVIGNTVLGSRYLDPAYLFNQGSGYIIKFVKFITDASVVEVEKTILILVAIFFIAVIFYTIVRLFEIREKEHKHLHHEIHEYAHHKAEEERKLRDRAGDLKNVRWAKVLDYLFSEHSGDWKLSIIEADAMLEELLDQMGFKGESLGEKLKNADQESFRELPRAWEVHTIRNRIAHEGLMFDISQHEAKRVIAIYEQIFRAYGFV